jgi:2-oxoglutarate ferredoxin oxidoreductase subunit alpha
MVKNNMTLKIGGEAGQGVESSGAGFAKALARGGLHIFSVQDYMSRIRGGHNFFQIRVHEKPLYSHTEKVDLLLALSPETIDYHKDEMTPGGGIIYDEDFDVDEGALEKTGIKPFPVPLKKIAKEAGDVIMANTAGLGAISGLTGFAFEHMAGVIQNNFGKKGQAIVDSNLDVAHKAYDYAHENYAAGFKFKLASVKAPPRMVINGNQAFAMGAVVGGCQFISAYPMTPATPIFEWLTAKAAKYGIVSKHTEDELAAALMAIGANHAGVRGMTTTSGGGFSLMVEALGMAGMTETPLVLHEVQRVGPSTGMPTRPEQGDLLFMLYASQGEFPRIVLTPGTIEEDFYAGWRAFNLAEKYQCPVIILTDAFLANSLRTVEPEAFGFDAVEIDRGELLTEKEIDALAEEYKRYAITKSGISPRVAPGHPKAIFTANSDEHTEEGHFADEDPANRILQMDKRMRKMDLARGEMRAPVLYGPKNADTTFIAWGSSYGPVRAAVDIINENGEKANLIHFTDIWPFPEEKVLPLLESAKRLVNIESNGTAQFASLLRGQTGRKVDHNILRYDGRPLSPDYILERLK